MSESLLTEQVLERLGLFDRVQVFALDVLHQRQGDGLAVVHVAHHHRNALQAGALRGSPAPFPGDDLEAARLAPAHDDGFDDALGANGLRQFLDAFLAEPRARLAGAAKQLVNGQFRGIEGRVDAGHGLRQQRVESLAESALRHVSPQKPLCVLARCATSTASAR